MSSFSIGTKGLEIPIIQGGMGIGISLGNLAGNVAKLGGMGVISTANIGYQEDDFYKNPIQANRRALKKEIEKAREIANGNGLLAVNIMVATTNYEETARFAIAFGIDAIISGAGLPLHLPEYTKDTQMLTAPIVSSGQAARVLCKTWDRKNETCPDFIVIEGPKAGGHLGFSKEALLQDPLPNEDQILFNVLDEIRPFEEKYKRKIPVFFAGGIRNQNELQAIQKMGAMGAQIATPFIATKECDASMEYKKHYIEASNDTVCIIQSPVGMPGRALKNPFVKRLDLEPNIPVTKCVDCISVCNPKTTKYCITSALIAAVKGDWDNGLFFSGSEVNSLTEIQTVSDVLNNFK